jgi:bacterioferritin (cytochrome b1)
MIELFNYYRDAELRGASLLMRLIGMMDDDPDAQVKLSLHLSEETHHAWLWTKRINDLGGEPRRVLDGYQTRIGFRTVPRTLLDILALTIVVEERAHTRYLEHLERPDLDEETRKVLEAATHDEKWHISWIKGKLDEIAARDGKEEHARQALEKYQEIDRLVYAELLAKEREAFGADAPSSPASYAAPTPAGAARLIAS